ncbi:glycoside-pentoside-hexuronide (GPH):cation symporter [Pectinatus haikarae]|uniref:GPH family glycoside/pentoside/hexuronide:cation symporter n=1 Tax=Pectinatus haikarae TaxID=349096 RepID=A0ABT9YB11_9FIRM|nr:glycoside-pentoside-hexuronide (GPH):cation symporter [Pectinatus haikarae]MDQ0204736.1 GPH family glycoside/pentoside/hexuronide:cation symporter [Pectinatus haikarae]
MQEYVTGPITAPSKKPTGTQNINNQINHFQRLSWKEKISYGFGDFGNGFMFDLGQAYLTKYWIDICAIPAAAVAGIFAFTKIFDAFMDPIAGSLIDRRKNIGSRGKFRPVMMISSILLALLTVVTFTMPELSLSGKILFAYAAYMAWGLVYSFTNIPYGSLASVMTRDVNERSQLATTRQAGSIGAQLITGIGFVPIVLVFDNPHHGFFIAAAIMAVIGIVGFYICYRNTKENVPVMRNTQAEKKAGFKDYLKVVFTNKPLLCIILMTLFTISAMNTNNQMMIFFCQYNLGNMGLQPLVNGIMMGCSVLGILMIPKLVKLFGKKRTAVGGLLIGFVANILNFVIATNIYTFIVLVTIGYVALAIPNGITWAFVSDVIDYGEWHNGIRKEGITYAAFNFSRKMAQALAAIVSSGILVLTGYVSNTVQSAETLTGIKAAMTLYPGVALGIAAVIISIFYGLSDNKYKKIADDLSNGLWENGQIK